METSQLTSETPTEWPKSRHADGTQRRKLPVSSSALRKLAGQFLRYALVGGLAFVVDFAFLSGVLQLGGHYMLATLVGFMAGLATNYALCVFWVWRGTQATSSRDMLIFTLIGIGGLLLTALLMWVSVELLTLNPQLAKVFIAAIVLVWNFSLRKMFVFFR